MKVCELIQTLQKCNQNMEIQVSETGKTMVDVSTVRNATLLGDDPKDDMKYVCISGK